MTFPWPAVTTVLYAVYETQVLATASAVSRANMATADWLRHFEFDRVVWSCSRPNAEQQALVGVGQAAEGKQQAVYEAVGGRIVEDVLNVSGRSRTAPPRGWWPVSQ